MTDLADTPASALWEEWLLLDAAGRVAGFHALPEDAREDFFESLDPREQVDLLLALPGRERRLWVRTLAPDDAADLVQEAPADERPPLLDLLDDATRFEVRALLAYAEDEAGGLMNPRFARVRPDLTVGEAIRYLRRQAAQLETLYYIYVLDEQQHLVGVLSLRELFQQPDDRPVHEIMHREVITVPEDADQEAVARLYVQQDFAAIPVTDATGRLRGIITFDDIADVVREEATEDIQKLGAVAPVEEPYLSVRLTALVRKRADWLAVLFLGEMLTATAMGFFEHEIAKAVVLALFIPLIISSGGNSGSQATTLIIRAMALGEVKLRDWWRVLVREIGAGLALGLILGAIGLVRILLWQVVGHPYSPHAVGIGLTVAVSLVGVVLWGSVVGSMLPFALRRVGFDPASASAPLVATLVDVTGLVIYFTAASILLAGTLL